MPIEPNSGLLLEVKIDKNKIFLYNDKISRSYPIVNKILYNVNLEEDSLLGEFQNIVFYGKYDRAMMKIISDTGCPKCKTKLINFILLGPNKKRVFICTLCNNNWYN
jgi:hypothetical protein